MKEFYKLILPTRCIESIDYFRNIQNFKNYENCIHIVKSHQIKFKKSYNYEITVDKFSAMFYVFCMRGYLPEVKIMISQISNICQKSSISYPHVISEYLTDYMLIRALKDACDCGKISIVKFLLLLGTTKGKAMYGTFIKIPVTSGVIQNLFWDACIKGRTKIVKLLLSLGTPAGIQYDRPEWFKGHITPHMIAYMNRNYIENNKIVGLLYSIVSMHYPNDVYISNKCVDIITSMCNK